MQNSSAATLHLTIDVQQNVTVLPRCLQILSRRGFILTTLTTEQLPDGEARLVCSAEGPRDWHDAIPGLLEKLVDVRSVGVQA